MKKGESNNLLGNSSSQSKISGYNLDNTNGNSSAMNQLRSQSIDLKIPLSIPGVTSSDSYLRMSQIDQENRKLKKKMKEKLKSGDSKSKKKSKKYDIEDEDEDEEENQGNGIKVREYEMPEGAIVDSDDDMNKDLNDPHRALDINLDEPLKDYERVPQQRCSLLKADTNSNNNKIENGKEPKSSETKKSKTSSKSATESTENKDSKKKKEKKNKKSKEESKSSKKTKLKSNNSIDLLMSTEPLNRSENDYNELLSPEHEIKPSLTPTNTNNNNNNVSSTKDDDLDFWLSSSKPEANDDVMEEVEGKKEKKSKSKKVEGNGDLVSESKEKKKVKKLKKDDEKNGDEESKPKKSSSKILKDSSPKDDLYKNLASNKYLRIVIFFLLSYEISPKTVLKLRIFVF